MKRPPRLVVVAADGGAIRDLKEKGSITSAES